MPLDSDIISYIKEYVDQRMAHSNNGIDSPLIDALANGLITSIVGSTNQVTVTSNGTVYTLTLPQDIGTGSTPQFARIGLGTSADASAKMKAAGQYFSVGYDAGNSGSTKTIDWNNGNRQYITLTASCTFTFSNPKADGIYSLFITQDSSGNWTPTLPSTVKWPSGITPTWTLTANKQDIVSMIYSGKESLYKAGINQNYAIT